MLRKNPDTHTLIYVFLKTKQKKNVLANLAEWLWMTMTLIARIHYMYVGGQCTSTARRIIFKWIVANTWQQLFVPFNWTLNMTFCHKQCGSLVPSWKLNGEFWMFRHKFNVWNAFQTSYINHHAPLIFGEWIHFSCVRSFVFFILFVYSVIRFFGCRQIVPYIKSHTNYSAFSLLLFVQHVKFTFVYARNTVKTR